VVVREAKDKNKRLLPKLNLLYFAAYVAPLTYVRGAT
jgi:hypothetical protein